jgi:hypothetical protein
MEKLNLPEYVFKTRPLADGGQEIFDPVRKKYLKLTPEEWVRQNFIQYLVNEKAYPQSLVLIEKGLTVNRMKKRFDAVVYSKQGHPLVLIEFKSPKVNIHQKVFEQIAAYNLQLKVKYLVVSNGLKHYSCKVNHENNDINFLTEIPNFNELI